MVCMVCGSGRFTPVHEDERFAYYACTNCGNTSVMPKDVRLM